MSTLKYRVIYASVLGTDQTRGYLQLVVDTLAIQCGSEYEIVRAVAEGNRPRGHYVLRVEALRSGKWQDWRWPVPALVTVLNDPAAMVPGPEYWPDGSYDFSRLFDEVAEWPTR